jgi:hypothetical protein
MVGEHNPLQPNLLGCRTHLANQLQTTHILQEANSRCNVPSVNTSWVLSTWQIFQTLTIEANYQQLTNTTTTETNSCTLEKELPMWTILVETL